MPGGACEDLRGNGETGLNQSQRRVLVVGGGNGYADSILDWAAADGDFAQVERGAGGYLQIIDVDGVEKRVAPAVFDEPDSMVALPVQPGRGSVDVGGDVLGLASGVGDEVDIATG